MEKFIQLGEKFGLEGEKLLEFVHEQQELEREEKRLEEEKEEKRRQLEEEKEEKRRQLEEEKEEKRRRPEDEKKREDEEEEERRRREDEERGTRRQERELRKLEMAADIMRQKEAGEAAKREHELELARLRNTDDRPRDREDRAKATKLPSFVDGKDDLDACLKSLIDLQTQPSGTKLDGYQSSVLCCLDEHLKSTHVYLRVQLKFMTK